MTTQPENSDRNFREYYRTDRYKGFYKCHAAHHSTSRMTHVIFSNGKTKIFAHGLFVEDAMVKAFIAIDQYHKRDKKAPAVRSRRRLESVTV